MSYSKIYSLLNRYLDGLQVSLRPDRQRYHKELRKIIDKGKQEWKSADYGTGYLYQSFPQLGLRGFRKTDIRVAQMDILGQLSGQDVLEIGCNTGFLSLMLSAGTRRYVAFDNNPFLIDIAQLTQAAIGNNSVQFQTTTIEIFSTDKKFDVVLSFANHSTWDGNMTLALEKYFAKLQSLLVPSGLLFFESHHPALENKSQVLETLKIMQAFFSIEEQRVLTQGSPWDRGRTFVRARSLITA
jgi:SAM-dependent methyltransferase